jgi:hypothetical protein
VDDSKTIKAITRYVGNYYGRELTPDLAAALRDSLSRGQLMSKITATQLAAKHSVDSAFFIGHWHGLLPMLFYEHGVIKSATGIELDPFWVDFSNQMNHYWNWKSTCGDADNFVPPDTDMIVNTSCEHMTDKWLDLVMPGVTVCAQSTDYIHPTHINTVASLEEFADKWSEFSILESDTTRYDVYSRFTIVAVKN